MVEEDTTEEKPEEEEEQKEEKETEEEKPSPEIIETEQTGNLIDEANQAAERIEKAEKQLSRTLDRQEAMTVEKTLSGRAKATGAKQIEETPEEYTDRVVAGNVELKDYE